MSRKNHCAVVMLIVCDDQGRVLHYHIGWPGSVHDNRVWRTCRLQTKCGDHFAESERLLGDSAFTPSQHLVPAFKSPSGQPMSENHSEFNTLLASVHVRSEHCIGVLKGRFPFLRSIRFRLGSKSDLRRTIRHVGGTVVLHNLLMEEDINHEWCCPDGAESVNTEPVTLMNQPCDDRRNELMIYFSELDNTNTN